MDLVYNIKEGARYKVGRIAVQIKGEYPHTKLTTVLNRTSVHPGQIADIREFRASERRVKASQIFSNDIQKGETPKLTFSPPGAENAETGVADDAPKRVRMVFLRDVDKKKIFETYKEGFEKNGAAPATIAKLDLLAPALVDMRKGLEMFVTYVPGQGTTVAAAGGQPVTIEGKDFADAMFRNWLGPKPADGGLKKAFLGK